jgi:MFS transporter, AAHS family, 4-hydroxybenzoate transporter
MASPITVPQDDQGAGEWTPKSAMIVALCFVLNMVDGMDVLIVSYIAPALQKDWDVSPAELSIVFSMGLAGMALGGLGLAPLADRVGRKRMILVAISLMSVAMYASSHATSIVQLSAIRFVVGTGIGTVLACIAAIAARVAPAKHRNFAVGVLQAGYPIGAMLTGFAAAWALPLYGWQTMLVATAAISAIFVPIVALVLPHTATAAPEGPAPRLADTISADRRLPSYLLWTATICGFMALYFIASWITKLAIEAGLPETNAIIASAIYNFGAFAGTVAGSIAATRMDVRKLCGALLLMAAVVFLVFGGVAMPLTGVLIAAFLMGITLQGGFNMLYPIAALVYPDKVRATGIGWAFGIGRIGAFTGPILGGWALSQDWPLVAVFGIFVGPLVIAAVAASRIRLQGGVAGEGPGQAPARPG